MDYTNYTLFEIIKFKNEFLECLEYTLLSNDIKQKDIETRLLYLKSELKNGLYKNITSSLFLSFKHLNEYNIKFIKKYTVKKITKLNKTKKIKNILDYNENLINCYETFNYIINKLFI